MLIITDGPSEVTTEPTDANPFFDGSDPVVPCGPAAGELIAAGSAVCRVKAGEKRPDDPGWNTRSAVPSDFDSRDSVGIIAGPLSDGNRPGHALVVIDLDSAHAVRLADEHLPATGMIDGRAGKPRSHRYFLTPLETVPAAEHSAAERAAAAATEKTGHPGPRIVHFKDADGRGVLDLIGTGGMAVCPPSRHRSGELRAWEGGVRGEPAVVDYPTLRTAVDALAEAAGAVERADREPAASNTTATDGNRTAEVPAALLRRIVAYLNACPAAVDGQGGHDALFRVARSVVYGFDLDPTTAAEVIAEHYSPRCVPPWSAEEIRHKCEDADAVPYDKARGYLLGENGNPDPNAGRTAANPHRLAREFLKSAGARHRYWRGDTHVYTAGAYRPVPPTELAARVNAWLDTEFRRLWPAAVAAWRAADGKGAAPTVQPVTAGVVTNVVAALESETLVPSAIEQPAWLDGAAGPTGRVIAVANGLLDLDAAAESRSDALLPASESYFTPTVLPFGFDPDAPEPTRWLRFLSGVWPDDRESIGALQEWCGYLLSGSTAQQKIALLIGPPRSGKGTIGRVIRGLLGDGNVSGPTLDTFAGRWGLASLACMSAAIISDARVGSRIDAGALTERLLSVSGEDVLDVERKGRDLVPTKLPTRLMILSNVLPRFADASPALAGRMLTLRFRQSFTGKEDTTLTDALLAELPGIFLWALVGWRRLRDRGHFVQPVGGMALLADLADLSSPVACFVRDRCDVGSGYTVSTGDLYDDWKGWCEVHGRNEPGTAQMFGRDLRAVVPDLEVVRPRTDDRGRGRHYTGVRLHCSVTPDPDPDGNISDADLVAAWRAYCASTVRTESRSDHHILTDLLYQLVSRHSR